MALPIYEFTINPEDNELGMTAMSLVDKPAMESTFHVFNKQEKENWKPVVPVKLEGQEVKYIIGGLALIPNKLVYRIDEESGQEYYGFFSEATIEMLVEKFMKEAIQGTTQKMNTQHDDKTQGYLVEVFILRNEAMVEAMKKSGFPDAIIGAAYFAYKMEDKVAYEKAAEGLYTGFSIEVMLQRELKMNKNNVKINKNYMTKIKNFVDKFKSLLQEIEGADTFEDVNVPDVTDKVLRIGEVGQPVLWVTADDSGTETTAPAEAGDYVLEDGRTISVDAQGNLMEIKEAGTPIPPIPDEGFAKYPWDQCIADNTPKYGKDGAEKICGKIKANNSLTVETALAELAAEGDVIEELKCKPDELATSGDTAMPAVSGDTAMPAMPAESGTTAGDVEKKTLGELVVADGVTIIKVLRENGVITEASVEAEQDLIKKEDYAALQVENADLKLKLSKVTIKPAFNEFNTPKVERKSEAELAKMNSLDRTLYRLGLDKEK